MSPANTISGLESHIGYWLRLVSNHVSDAFREKLAVHHVTVAEWVILRALWDRPAVAPSVLASDMNMTRGTISKLADRLIDKGLAVRHADESDGRAQTLTLSRQGLKLMPVLAALADDNDAAFFGGLTAEERATLIMLMRKVVRQKDLKTVPTQ